MSLGIHRAGSNGLAALLVVVGITAPWSGASAHKYSFHTLYSFCAEANCTDGEFPEAMLLMDRQGNLYGTTVTYGASGQSQAGTVFELIPNGKRWKHRTLYSFCSQANCADGDNPTGNLIIDASGTLYGTTLEGGPYDNDAGVVFELLPTDRKWKYKQLYAFCGPNYPECEDGTFLRGGLTYAGAASGQPYDGVSPLFGNTVLGGAGQGNGVAFRLDPQNRRWKETVLYSFCSSPSCTDGGQPYDTPVTDSAGRLFGTTTIGGGTSGGLGGTVYSITGMNESVTYAFCPASGCADGAEPTAPVVLDNEGHIFGTALEGGAGNPRSGVLFAISGSSEQVLHSFCSEANYADGVYPQAGVIADASGNLFGATLYGGSNDHGVIYQFNGGTERVLHTFCTEAGCPDGSNPYGGLVMDAAGNLYGTTEYGGANGGGTVFELQY
jgi:uncharacterized repeat protein (TIGR03803 family)